MIKLSLSLLLIVLCGNIFGFEKTYETAGTDSVQFEFAIGNIELSNSNDSKVYLKTTSPLQEGCKIISKVDEDDLVIKLSTSFFSLKSNCETNLILKVPAHLDIEIENGKGNISVKSLTGEFDYEIGSGNVTIDSPLKELNGEAGSGNLVAKNISGDIEIEYGSGNIELHLGKVTKSTEVEVDLGSGNTVIVLKDKIKVHTKVNVGSGNVTSEVGEDKASLLKIKGNVGSGNFIIK